MAYGLDCLEVPLIVGFVEFDVDFIQGKHGSVVFTEFVCVLLLDGTLQLDRKSVV